jgi:E2/UBC family protein E/multiubiquitin
MSQNDQGGGGDKAITIHIDEQPHKVTVTALTGAQIRALHNPPIAADRALFLKVNGPGDDQRIEDGQSVPLTEGIRFFSVIGKINPGGAAASPEVAGHDGGHLLETDVAWLTEKGYDWTVTPNGGGGGSLIIAGLVLAPMRYDQAQTDLLLQIPNDYNDAGLDMWWIAPAIRLRVTGAYPPAAEHFEMLLGRRWQRFSRHLNQAWRAGLDDVPRFMTYVIAELQSPSGC